MQQTVNKVYAPLFQSTKGIRYAFLMGGRGGGRSTVASQYALSKLTSDGYFRCAIMRYILGDIRNSIFQEILDRAEESGQLGSLKINEGFMDIEYGRNSINAVGFKKSSGDQKAKLKSLASYNTVIIEEAEEISEEDFTQLDDSLRTMKGDILIIFLLNPPAKTHWIIKRFFNLEEIEEVEGFYKPVLKPEITDALFIWSSYKDNIANIAQASINNYENYKNTKPTHYYNMIKGFVPETVVGKIYNNWQEIETIPHEAVLIGTGLDFGYTVDPTAIVNTYRYNGGLIFDEIAYSTGMKNKAIATVLSNRPENVPVGADSAEPKSIDEIKDEDSSLVFVPVVKGKDSVKYGIGKVQSQKISYTKRSKNIKAEYENYAWFIDKDGVIHNIPKPKQKDHAMDAIRYIVNILEPDEDLDDEYRDRAESRQRSNVSTH